jgi:hypothetical protein
LKLNVSLNAVRNRLRRVRVHAEHHHEQATSSQCACVGFSVATRGVTRPTSFEVEELAGSSACGCSTLMEHFNSHLTVKMSPARKRQTGVAWAARFSNLLEIFKSDQPGQRREVHRACDAASSITAATSFGLET